MAQRSSSVAVRDCGRVRRWILHTDCPRPGTGIGTDVHDRSDCTVVQLVLRSRAVRSTWLLALAVLRPARTTGVYLDFGRALLLSGPLSISSADCGLSPYAV